MSPRVIVAMAWMAAALAMTGPVYAAGWYSGTIEQVEITSSGEVMAFLQAPSNHECGTKRVDYISPGDANSKNFLAALLAWQAQGKPVRVYIASCDGTTGIFTVAVNEP